MQEIPDLNYREIQTLILTCKGLTCKEIAQRLHLSYKTVEHYRSSLLRKTGTHNKAGLIVYSLKNQLFRL
ncbi:MAG: LuxR C-terminal-related transcriptional regulator [Bacteroidota bacterium]|nr:LuxR C-terminal-related transcriptional regulator [Bacteroidota bacterium]